MHGVVQLFQFLVDVRAGGGIADVGIDFALAGGADGHGLEVAVIHVGGNNHAPTRDFAAHQLRLKLFALGDVLHFFGDDALPRKMHLRDVSRPIGARHCRLSFFNPAIAQCHRFLSDREDGTRDSSPRVPVPHKQKLWHRA